MSIGRGPVRSERAASENSGGWRRAGDRIGHLSDPRITRDSARAGCQLRPASDDRMEVALGAVAETCDVAACLHCAATGSGIEGAKVLRSYP